MSQIEFAGKYTFKDSSGQVLTLVALSVNQREKVLGTILMALHMGLARFYDSRNFSAMSALLEDLGKYLKVYGVDTASKNAAADYLEVDRWADGLNLTQRILFKEGLIEEDVQLELEEETASAPAIPNTPEDVDALSEEAARGLGEDLGACSQAGTTSSSELPAATS